VRSQTVLAVGCIGLKREEIVMNAALGGGQRLEIVLF
jgi:hypothetical protein